MKINRREYCDNSAEIEVWLKIYVNMKAVERTHIITWEEFVEKFKNHSESDNIIFRGQSNGIELIEPTNDSKGRVIATKPVEWELISSFNRYYPRRNQYRFVTLLSQQLDNDLFRINYKHYEIVKELKIHEWSKIDKIMFLQHYGCPTCFIDFTKDPLVALYFALTSIKGSSGTTYDGEGNIFNYSDDCFMSIYEINCDVLKHEIGFNELNTERDLFLDYRNYEYLLDDSSPQSVVVSLLLNPKPVEKNFNLPRQKGCFLFYDCHNFNFRGRGFETFLDEYVSRKNIKLSKPAVIIYRIRYNSIFANRHRGDLIKEGLFMFLSKKKINGACLFNDLQGLKYDFNFFHDH